MEADDAGLVMEFRRQAPTEAALGRSCRQWPIVRAAANLGQDLPPNGEACFPFIRYGTSSETGGFDSPWGGRCPPQGLGFCAAAHRSR